MPSHHVLIIGCGSIGYRHARAFIASKRCRVTLCDMRQDLLHTAAKELDVPATADWSAALADSSIDAVVVATPAPTHVSLGREALSRGRHVLIEKPLSLNLEGMEALLSARAGNGRFAAVAYVQRLNPVVIAVRDFLRGLSWGPVLQASLSSGQHFPTFRPAYREIYYRDRAQGGGCIQDGLTHSVDAIEWILGPTTRVYCDAAHQALEGVSVEDTVNVTARNGATLVSYSSNQFQAPNEARWDFHTAAGSVRVEQRQFRWGTFALGAADWNWNTLPSPGRDGLFQAQANAFLDGCEGKTVSLCSLEEGMQAVRFNLAAFRSLATGGSVDPQSL